MTLKEQFERFDNSHPVVYNLFKKFAIEASWTHKRFSADAILHRIRWYTQVETQDFSGFKINNNYAAFYARKLAKDMPQFKNFFSFRKSVADK